MATGNGQQMQVVIAQHSLKRVSQVTAKAHGFQRSRAAVNQVATAPKLVFLGIKIHRVQQPAQFVITALNITNCVNRHQLIAPGNDSKKGSMRTLNPSPSSVRMK